MPKLTCPGSFVEEPNMPFSQTVHVRIEPGSKITLVLNYQEKSMQRDVPFDRIEVEVKGDKWSGKLRWELNIENAALTFIDANILSDPRVHCVAKCLGISISTIVAECVWSNWGDARKIMECIRSKAAAALVDGGACIAECFLTHP
jgi:hypothetical protein